ncbi:MAG: phosphohistidine phosphatase SixA [Desulfobacterota bacterium]|nr:phosphohistidine phosphatase SixA [Thermodesulfobacteriota bacterium]MDW8002804.1 phosphohistidine phosphatase SixA [Deltaproteobacteria bacterium]
MIVYLCQHGEAKPESEDPNRSLTDKGKKDVTRVGEYLLTSGIQVSQILHSGKLRARETAEILSQFVKPALGIKEVKGLNPLDDPTEIAEIINGAKDPLMIVGHMPNLGSLSSLLILGSKDREVVRFSFGAVIGLLKTDKGWVVESIIRPENL